MAEVTLDGVRKLFGSVTAVEDLTLSICCLLYTSDAADD